MRSRTALTREIDVPVTASRIPAPPEPTAPPTATASDSRTGSGADLYLQIAGGLMIFAILVLS